MKPSLALTVRGGTSLSEKTGDWRFFRPILKTEVCTGCGLCYLLCPDSAAHSVGKKFAINYTYCKGCGICAEECPANAIEMILEEK